MPSRSTPSKTSPKTAKAAPSKAPARGAAVKPAAKPAGRAATAKTPAKLAAKSAAKSTAKAATKTAAKAPTRAKSPAKAAAKTPAKSPAAKSPARPAAKSPAKTAAKAPARTAAKTPARPVRAVAPDATPDESLVLRDAAGTLGGAEAEAPEAAAGVVDVGAAPVDATDAAEVDDVAVELPTEPSAPEPEPTPEDLSPQEWFAREKARRTRPATADVMAEARALLLQAVAEAGPRRGRPVRVGAAAKGKPTKKLAPDEFELEEYRPGEKKGPGEA